MSPAPANAKSKAKTKPLDKRQMRTRNAIVQAGYELFGAHDVDSISIDEIIGTAEISKQSFYNHFKDKDQLLSEILRESRAHLERIVDEVNKDEVDPARRLVRGISVYARNALDDPHHARIIARMLVRDFAVASQMNAGLQRDIANGLAKGRLAVFTMDTGIAFVVGVTQALVACIVSNPEISMAVTTTQQFVTLTLRAFGLSPIEAEMLAAQASDQIVRQGLPARPPRR